MYSNSGGLSFSYLHSAVEASLDIKKDQVDPNKKLVQFFTAYLILSWDKVEVPG
jgi:hypothetical protein